MVFFRTASDHRPYHLGSYPAENLQRDDAVIVTEAARPPVAAPLQHRPPQGPLAVALRDYLTIFIDNSSGEPATQKAPVTDDPHRRMIDVKGYSLFMNASQVGICRVPDNAWASDASPLDHQYAVVLLLEHGRLPEPGNPARALAGPAIVDAADSRIGGIAVCLAGHRKSVV